MGCIVSFFVDIVFKIIKFVFNIVIEILTKILLFFGLWLPSIYTAAVLIYDSLNDGVVFSTPLYKSLFYIGLAACLLYSVIKTINNLVYPNGKPVVQKTYVLQPDTDQTRRTKQVQLVGNDRQPPDDSTALLCSQFSVREQPSIYRHAQNPSLVIYEYSNRYEMYVEHDNILSLKTIEFKQRTPD